VKSKVVPMEQAIATIRDGYVVAVSSSSGLNTPEATLAALGERFRRDGTPRGLTVVMPMVAGALIYKLRPHMTGARLAGVILLIPMADGIANGATAWPMWISLNQTDVSYVWTYLASFVTLGLALYAVWIIGLAVARSQEEVVSETLWEKVKAVVRGDSAPATGAGAERDRAPDVVAQT
jgi:hypothetical protein